MDGQAKVSLILELKNRLSTGMSRAKQKLSTEVGAMKNQLNDLKMSHIKAFDGIKAAVPGLSSSIASLANPYALAAAAAMAFLTLGIKAATFANGWQSGMAKVNVTAQLSQKELKSVSDRLLDIGAKNVIPLEQIPDAFNQIVSAGLDVNTALKALDPILKGAKAGFTDVYTVANAATSIMLASNEDITVVMDTMFATLNKGKAEFKDLANYLPKVISSSKSLGLGLGEVSGAFATLTQKFKSEQAATMMENVFKAFDTGSIRKNMEQFGVKVFDKGKIRPFIEIIEDIKKATDGLSAESRSKLIEKMGFDQEAKVAILSMLGSVKELRENIDFTTNSTGELGKAVEAARQPLDDWKEILNKIKKEIVPIGTELLNLASAVGSWILETINNFKKLYNESLIFRDILKALGLIVQVSVFFHTLPWRLLGNVISFVAGTAKILGDSFAKLFGMSNFEAFYRQVRPYFIWLKEVVGQIADIIGKLFSHDFSGLAKAVANFNIPSISDIRRRQEASIIKEVGANQIDYLGVEKPSGDNPWAANYEKNKATPVTGSGSGGSGSDAVNNITGAAQPVRNQTINIDAFVKGGINTQHTNLQQMDERQLEAWFKNMFLRVMANSETAFQ